jgi:hypothetical protein
MVPIAIAMTPGASSLGRKGFVEGSLDLVKSSAVDGNLIDLGNRAREPRWPIDNP